MEENAGQTISDSEINKEAIPEENEAGSNNEPLLTENLKMKHNISLKIRFYNEPAFTDIPVYNPDKESDISSLLDIA